MLLATDSYLIFFVPHLHGIAKIQAHVQTEDVVF